MNDNESRPLPLWLKVAGTVFVAFHFLVLGANVLSSGSGPWFSPFGPSMAEGPQFAKSIAGATYDWYLEPLRFTHDYHFASNRVSEPEVKFEIKLYDKLGRVIETLDFPEKSGNPWLKHRLDLIAQQLGNDIQAEPGQGEAIAAPEGAARTVDLWTRTKDGTFVITVTPRHLVKDVVDFQAPNPTFKPSPWASLAAASYVRYQCRLHSAHSGELIRHSRPAVQPSLILLPQPEPFYQETVAAFKKSPYDPADFRKAKR